MPLSPSGDYTYLKHGFQGFRGIYRGKTRKGDRDVLLPGWLKLDLVFLFFFFKKIGHKSHCVSPAGLELLGPSSYPASASMPGVYLCAKPKMNCDDAFWYSILSAINLTGRGGVIPFVCMWV